MMAYDALNIHLNLWPCHLKSNCLVAFILILMQSQRAENWQAIANH